MLIGDHLSEITGLEDVVDGTRVISRESVGFIPVGEFFFWLLRNRAPNLRVNAVERTFRRRIRRAYDAASHLVEHPQYDHQRCSSASVLAHLHLYLPAADWESILPEGKKSLDSAIRYLEMDPDAKLDLLATFDPRLRDHFSAGQRENILLQKGRVLYELGRFDEAQPVLIEFRNHVLNHLDAGMMLFDIALKRYVATAQSEEYADSVAQQLAESAVFEAGVTAKLLPRYNTKNPVDLIYSALQNHIARCEKKKSYQSALDLTILAQRLPLSATAAIENKVMMALLHEKMGHHQDFVELCARTADQYPVAGMKIAELLEIHGEHNLALKYYPGIQHRR
ncbi:MAG TPA: hypothetical protein VJH97_03870 [Candidatus Nanoarchaeia archaeon]|nr:hypothetical protein [Candidatus Nanoarchaeia archaeon]